MKRIIQTGGLVFLLGALAVVAADETEPSFYEDLERVDHALKTNPTGALMQTRQS